MHGAVAECGSCLLSPRARLPPQPRGYLPRCCFTPCWVMLCSRHLCAMAGHATSVCKACLQRVSLATALGGKKKYFL